MRKKDETYPPVSPLVPDRRFTDQISPFATQIGPGTLFRGDINTTDPVEIRGTLDGDCRTSARCIVHEGGRVLGNIDAAALAVGGKVEAGVVTAEKVELYVTASVVATIRARVIVIADGAFFKGDIEGAGAPGGTPLMKDRRRP
jgi:cytoskeletal protein CcmA (bactofilin family)